MTGFNWTLGGRPLPPGSDPFAPWAREIAAIQAAWGDVQAWIGSNEFYAAFIEYGTRYQAPRPVLRTAIMRFQSDQAAQQKIVDRVAREFGGDWTRPGFLQAVVNGYAKAVVGLAREEAEAQGAVASGRFRDSLQWAEVADLIAQNRGERAEGLPQD